MKTVNVVAAVICDSLREKKSIFATARGYGEFKGQWEFPGGKIEAGETPQQALVREIQEELDIDECHRSQFGDMHRDIVRHFNKAQFFGFTGTPRFEVNGKVEGHIVQTTASLFGDCLHTYLIKDAIFDNNVLGFHVEYIKTIQGDYDLNDQAQVEGIDTDELLFADERMTMIANHTKEKTVQLLDVLKCWFTVAITAKNII